MDNWKRKLPFRQVLGKSFVFCILEYISFNPKEYIAKEIFIPCRIEDLCSRHESGR